jgi:ATP-binding cassette, subfamily D (ALD), peroxisomal long-chain fatty acid import protein
MAPSLCNLRVRADKAQLARFLEVYLRHRPVIQRCITAGFVAYVLGVTYQGLSFGGRQSTRKSNGKGKQKEDTTGKPARVAVRLVSHICLAVHPDRNQNIR